jgi:hypothetical protein
MFVTSGLFTPGTDFSSAVEADALCGTIANGVTALLSLNGRKWKAWLSDDNSSALARMTPGLMGSYMRPDGLPIGSPATFLAGGVLENPPDTSERGTVINCMMGGVWTGTKANGTATPGTCIGWTSGNAADSTEYGICNDTSGQWTENAGSSCNLVGHLYCFEQH